jgi:hypothetical protein
MYGYTPTNTFKVYTAGSGRIRGILKDCEGDLILQAQVASITLTIFQYGMGQYTAVPNYTAASIPITAILDQPATDCEGREFNLDFDPYDGEHPPFPTRNAFYVIELVFTSTNGTKSVHQIQAQSV